MRLSDMSPNELSVLIQNAGTEITRWCQMPFPTVHDSALIDDELNYFTAKITRLNEFVVALHEARLKQAGLAND